MKLSMSMLAWYLRELRPIAHIEDDEICIQGLRFVMDDVQRMQPEYLYFGNAEYFFADPRYEGAYLAVNRHSILIFSGSDYNELINGLLSAFDYFNGWEANLLDAAARNAPLAEFIDLAAPVLMNPIVVGNLDRSFVVSSSLDGHRTDPLWEEAARGFGTNHPAMYAPYYDADGGKIYDLSEKPILVQNVYRGGDPVMMLYLRQEEEMVAALAILQEDSSLTGQNFQLAPLVARYCLKAEEFISDSGAIQSGTAVLRGLLEGRDVGELNLSRLQKFLPSGPWRVLALRLTDRTDELAIRSMLARLRRQPAVHLPMQWRDLCLCLIADGDLLMHHRLPGVGVGASMPFMDLASMSIRLQQAQFALEQAAGMEGIFLCETFACDYLLRSFRSMEMTAALLHPALQTLERYDCETQSELRRTLQLYLQFERNQLLSAKALHIHPNTMRYRLQRIMELTDLTLEDPEELKYLRLSDWLE